MASTARRFRLIAGFALALAALAGCKGGGQEQVAAPDKLYDLASQDLRANNFKGAIQKLEALESHYPFTNAAKQGQLDLMFAYYRNREMESAIDQADQFIRENPTHPRVDYAYYIRGLAYFETGGGWLEDDYGLGWLYANSRTLRIADGPDEVHRNHIAKIEIASHVKL